MSFRDSCGGGRVTRFCAKLYSFRYLLGQLVGVDVDRSSGRGGELMIRWPPIMGGKDWDNTGGRKSIGIQSISTGLLQMIALSGEQ